MKLDDFLALTGNDPALQRLIEGLQQAPASVQRAAIEAVPDPDTRAFLFEWFGLAVDD